MLELKCDGCETPLSDELIKAIQAWGVARHLAMSDLLILATRCSGDANEMTDIAIIDWSGREGAQKPLLTRPAIGYPTLIWPEIHDEVCEILKGRRWAAWRTLHVHDAIGSAAAAAGLESPLQPHDDGLDEDIGELASMVLGCPVDISLYEALRELKIDVRPRMRSAKDDAEAALQVLRGLRVDAPVDLDDDDLPF